MSESDDVFWGSFCYIDITSHSLKIFCQPVKELNTYSGTSPFLERRLKPRLECSYMALVQSRNGNGMKFKEKGKVVNLSRSGIFMLLERTIPKCEEVSIRIVFPTGILEFGCSNLAMVGTVVRRENREDGALGIAIMFQNYRIL